MPIEPPADFNDALVDLPDDQFPYGPGCKVEHGVQSVLFHYRIPADDVANLEIEEFYTLLDFKSANPDGTAEEQQFYDDTINVLFTKSIRRRRMLLAVCRLLSDDPIPAFVPPPPPPAAKRKAVDVLPVPAKKVVADDDAVPAKKVVASKSPPSSAGGKKKSAVSDLVSSLPSSSSSASFAPVPLLQLWI